MKKINITLCACAILLSACSSASHSSVSEETGNIIIKKDLPIDSAESFVLDGGCLNMGYNTLEVNEENPDPYQTGYIENAILVQKDGKYGFYDCDGNVLTECQFTSVSQNPWTFYVYTEEGAYVMDSDFTSFSTIEGGIGGAYPEITIHNGIAISNGEPVKTPVYDYLSEDAIFLVNSDQGSGIIDQNGKILCEIDGWYSSVASTFSDGYVFLSDTEWTYDYETDQDSHGSLMLFNMNGDELMDSVVDDAGFMRDGYAPVKQNGKWGFVNTDGSPVSEMIFEEASSVYEGKAYVKYDGTWMIIDLADAVDQGTLTKERMDQSIKIA